MADTTISNLSPLTPSTGLYLPVTNGSNTGKVTLAEVCGVMTSNQIVNALGYTPVQPTSPTLAKAWVVFRTNLDSSGNLSTANTNRYLIASYNVGSVTKNTGGVFTVNFSPYLTTNDYSAQVTIGYRTDNITTGGQGQYCVPVIGLKTTNPNQSCQVGAWDDTTGAFSSDYSTGNTVINVAIFHN